MNSATRTLISRRLTTLVGPLALGETIDVLDRESRRPWTWREYGYAALESDVGIGQTAEQRLDEFVDFLPCLPGKIGDPCL
jgi:hypothetical protein